MVDPVEARQGYARDWLNAYKGDHPLFTKIKEAAQNTPRWALPPAIVTAIVRFSADEVWKPDPVLERKIVQLLGSHEKKPSKSERRRSDHSHDWSAWAGTGLTLSRHCLKRGCSKIQYRERRPENQASPRRLATRDPSPAGAVLLVSVSPAGGNGVGRLRVMDCRIRRFL